MSKLIIIISGIQQTSRRIASLSMKSNKIFYHNAYTFFQEVEHTTHLSMKTTDHCNYFQLNRSDIFYDFES